MQEEISRTIKEAVKELFSVDLNVELTRPEEQFGDFATNVALQIAHKAGQTPREVAQAIADKLKDKLDIQVAGPGFINITLKDSDLFQAASNAPGSKLQLFAGQTILAEYSDPNPLKPLHAGHLYTTLVGDAISRLIENAGAKTIRINYGGDVGLHVGRGMWAIIRQLGGENPEKLEEVPQNDRAGWLGRMYADGTAAYEEDPVAKEEIIDINRRVYKLHADNDRDSAFAIIYWTVRQWSYDYFVTLYEQLQVKPFDRFLPESEVSELGLETVKAQTGDIYEESDGAVIFNGEKHGLHKRVFITSNGLPTYEAKDVGLLLTKWQDYHYDKSIVITANEQAQYFEVMLKSVEQFEPEPAGKTKHLTHGVVKLQGGIKMSSRKGNVLLAYDILQAAEKSAKELNENSSYDTVLAAVKYAFIKPRIGGDIVYDPNESVSLEGNSGPYLQYAHARARSILGKAKGSVFGVGSSELELNPGERSLTRKVSEYPDVVEKATKELLPHYIATYLYELAQIFNSFYEKNRVIGDEREELRLKLVNLYADTLKNGLELLGITAPDKM